MKPLGISLWQLTAGRPMYEAGGRLFVDVTQGLASPASRAGLLEMMSRGDPLVGDALRTILERTVASICRMAHWSACPFPPGPSRGGPA
jgi:rifampicin phosphotransferase